MKLLLVLFAGFSIAFSQPAIRDFDNCGTLQSVVFNANDVVRFHCDTVYVLNKLTFRRYDAAYRDLRKKGTNISNLMNAYDELIAVQQQRLKDQDRRYNELRMNFKELSEETQSRIAASTTRLGSAVGSMEQLNNRLTETNNLLGEARDILKAEQRSLFVNRLLWGVGGVAVGLVAGILIAK